MDHLGADLPALLLKLGTQNHHIVSGLAQKKLDFADHGGKVLVSDIVHNHGDDMAGAGAQG